MMSLRVFISAHLDLQMLYIQLGWDYSCRIENDSRQNRFTEDALDLQTWRGSLLIPVKVERTDKKRRKAKTILSSIRNHQEGSLPWEKT